MSSGPGWSGNLRAVMNYLRVVGADQEEDRFLLSGEGIIFFMGIVEDNADVVVPASTKYYINGQPSSLAVGLQSTSSGIGVQVISGHDDGEEYRGNV